MRLAVSALMMVAALGYLVDALFDLPKSASIVVGVLFALSWFAFAVLQYTDYRAQRRASEDTP